MKKIAFTLVEILIALSIIGILSVIMLQTFKSSDFKSKANPVKVYKVIDNFDEASGNIRGLDSTYCPEGTFINKIGSKSSGYTYELAIANLPNNNKEETIFDMFGGFIKFEKRGLNFCNYSGYCDNVNKDIIEEANRITNIPAIKYSGDVYVGITLLDPIANCPDYYMPQNENQLSPKTKIGGETPKCWAKLYVDVNGLDGPNEMGKDIFIFGLDEKGIYH